MQSHRHICSCKIHRRLRCVKYYVQELVLDILVIKNIVACRSQFKSIGEQQIEVNSIHSLEIATTHRNPSYRIERLWGCNHENKKRSWIPPSNLIFRSENSAENKPIDHFLGVRIIQCEYHGHQCQPPDKFNSYHRLLLLYRPESYFEMCVLLEDDKLWVAHALKTLYADGPVPPICPREEAGLWKGPRCIHLFCGFSIIQHKTHKTLGSYL